ncbi:hypothetical protein IWW38_001096 [Coemansia aciculifera]|uniref:Uncharacterized protein n=1 Tax=Coemansia aciculifera TaxID=417176 RepID=A0ACC1M873_9FUNG|nr:hypothetical protein IWW38_001096 [Coemansia aciculifera]
MDRSESTSEKLLGASNAEHHLSPPPPMRRSQRQQHRSLVDLAVKVVFGFIFTFLLVMTCIYAGSKTIFDTDGLSSTGKDKAVPDEKVLVEPKVRDCRSTGCFNNFECVAVAADFACFIPPCPATVYECQPNAMLKDPEDALFSIQPISAARNEQDKGENVDSGYITNIYGESIQLTEGYYACIQQNGGKRSWRHPTEPCNTCRCNPRGGISCTKMLCKQGDQPRGSYASRILTTVMSLVDPEAGASISGTSTPRYTSIVIDIQQ